MTAWQFIKSILKWTCLIIFWIVATPFIIIALPEMIVWFAAGWLLASVD